MKDRWLNVIEQLYRKVILIIFSLIIVMLTVFSIFISCYVNRGEHTYYIWDKKTLHMLGICSVFGGIYISRHNQYVKRVLEKIKKSNVKYMAICSIVVASCYCILVFVLQLQPRADQSSVIEVANQMRAYDFSAFMKGGYADIYPNQIGIILLFYFISFIFGNHNYIVIQLLNIIALFMSYYLLSKISYTIFNKKSIFYLTAIILVFFFPLTLYITFIYGNILGLMFSLFAIDEELRYFSNRQNRHIVLAAVFIAIAIIIKSNYLITLIAMIIFLIHDMIINKKIKNMICIIGVIVIYMIGSSGTRMCIKYITGHEVTGGTPKVAWMAMGLQESEMASGWYNGFNLSAYIDNNCDIDLAREISRQNIKERLNEFKNDKLSCIRFFIRKTVSQWNDPTFEGFWILENRETSIEYAPWIKWILVGEGNWILLNILNVFQTILLMGTCLYLLVGWKRIDSKELIFAVIFIGGFLFHMMWEAKSQYTITYFILLIPYTIQGYYNASLKLDNIINTYKNRKYILRLIIIMGIVIIIGNLGTYVLIEKMGIKLDNEAYAEYHNSMRAPLADGYYLIKPVILSDDYLAVDTEGNLENGTLVVLKKYQGIERRRTSIKTINNISTICFQESNRVLDVPSGIAESGVKVQIWDRNNTVAQQWILEKESDGIYYIRYNNEMALTYDEITREITISTFIGHDNQKWRIIKN